VIASLFLVSMTLQAPPISPMGDRILSRAVVYAPQDLKPLFKVFEEDFKRGLCRPVERPTPESLEKSVSAIIQKVKHHEGMPVIIEELAAVTRQTILYMDPVREGKNDALCVHVRSDFPRFIQSRLERFPVVFYGFDPQLYRGDSLGYFRNQTRDTKDLSRLLLLDYTRGSGWATYRAFDDQSNAFGVAQITLNQTFSAILNLWYYVWTKSGGRWGPLKPGLNTEKVWLLGYGY
jgi:hypothetical protein